MEPWIFWIVAITLTSIVLIIEKSKKNKSLLILENREPLSDDEIYVRFYAANGFEKEHVIKLWHEIADTLEVSAEKLRPADRFGIDIGVRDGFVNFELDALDHIIQQRYKNLKITTKQDLINTVDDYIKRFADKK